MTIILEAVELKRAVVLSVQEEQLDTLPRQVRLDRIYRVEIQHSSLVLAVEDIMVAVEVYVHLQTAARVVVDHRTQQMLHSLL